MNFGKINTALWVFWLLYWIISARGNKKSLQRPQPGWRLAVLIALLGFGVFIYKSPSPRLAMRILPEVKSMQLLGTTCCAAGVLFAIWARRILGANWSAAPAIKENHELITAGPYAFVRHPIYTGLLLALFGSVVLAHGRLRDLLLFFIAVILLGLKSRVEEKLMLATFPDTYPDYRRRTKALIPFLF